MMDGVLEFLCIALLYAGAGFALLRRHAVLLVSIVVCATAAYDVLFIHASYNLPWWFVATTKLFPEYLTAALAVQAYRRRRLYLAHPPTRQLALGIMLPSAVLLVGSAIAHGPAHAVLGARTYLVAPLMAFLLYTNGYLTRRAGMAVLRCIALVAAVSAIVALRQMADFDGLVSRLWFFDYFYDWPRNPVLEGSANYLRDGNLRTTGIFVSPIIQTVSLLLGVAVLTTAVVARGQGWAVRVLALAGIPFLLYAQYTTHTRVGWILDALVIAVIVAQRWMPALLVRTARWGAWVAVAATFAFLLVGGTEESSAVGRLGQWGGFWTQLRPWGLGFGHPLVNTHFDSLVISAMLLFGALVVGPALYIHRLYRALWRVAGTAPQAVVLSVSAAVCAAAPYLFFFQFVAGSYPYRVYFLLLYLSLAYYERALRREAGLDHSGGAV